MKKELLKDYLLAFLSSILVILSFPDFDFNFLIWIAFVPLFGALKNKNLKQSFYLGWFSGFFINLFGFYWINDTISNYSNLHISLSLTALFLFALYSGLFFGLLFFLTKFLSGIAGTTDFLFFPVVYAGLELTFPMIFPWMLGNSLYNHPVLIQIADITGVIGLTFLIALINLILFEMLLNRKLEKYKLLAGLASLLIVIGYGIWSYYFRNFDLSQKLSFSSVQANITIDERIPADAAKNIIDRLLERTLDKKVNSDLLIWSEAVFPYYFRENSPSTELLKNIALKKKAVFIFGALTFKENDIFNSIITYSEKGELLKQYDKIKPLVFGEYLPFENQIPILKEWIQGGGHFTPGQSLTVNEIKSGIRSATPICFEMILPPLVRKFVNLGANLLINITNDVWFGNTTSPHQHFALCLFRAVENRVPFIRCANTGVSANVDLKGNILYRSEIFKPETVTGLIVTGNNWSFYKEFGELFGFINLFILLFLVALRIARNYKFFRK